MIAVAGALFPIFADGPGNKVRFPLLIGRLVVQHPFAAGIFGPQRFALALAVAADDRVGGLQNGAGAAVVLLQTDHAGLPKLLLKGEDVFDGGAAEFVDALVVIAHHTQVAMAAGQKADQQVLGMVGILILIHHDVAVAPLVFLQHLRELLEQPDGKQDDIVKIEGVGLPEHFLVQGVDLGGHLQGKVVAGVLPQPVGGQQLVLGAADIAQQGFGAKVPVAEIQLGHGVLDDPHAVVGIVDGEIPAVAQRLNLAAQDTGTGRVKGGRVDLLAPCAQHGGQPRAQLPRRLVGEGDGKDIPWGGNFVRQQRIRLFPIAAVGGAQLQ